MHNAYGPDALPMLVKYSNMMHMLYIFKFIDS